jgi:hypothetical protein
MPCVLVVEVSLLSMGLWKSWAEIVCCRLGRPNCAGLHSSLYPNLTPIESHPPLCPAPAFAPAPRRGDHPVTVAAPGSSTSASDTGTRYGIACVGQLTQGKVLLRACPRAVHARLETVCSPACSLPLPLPRTHPLPISPHSGSTTAHRSSPSPPLRLPHAAL